LSSENEPLRKLFRKDIKWCWTEIESNTFEKSLVTSDLVVAHFNSSLATSLIVDAGPIGLGTIIVQKQPGNSMKPVAYASYS